MTIGQTIRHLRKRKHIKQCDLAKLAGLSANALVGIEKDRVFPTKDTIDRICNAFGISVACLLLHSIDENDIQPEKKWLYEHIVKPLQEELL